MVIHSIKDTDSEQKEITHDFSKMEIAQLFNISPDDEIFDETAETSTERTPEPEVEEGDEVIIEDVTHESYPTYQDANSDLPDLATMVKQQTQEDLDRNVSERASTSEQPKEEWVKKLLEEKRKMQSTSTPQYTLSYNVSGRSVSGRIISWAYFVDLNVYSVKRERGIDYFERLPDLTTLPYYDMMELARLKLLYSETSSQSRWLERQLKKEFQTKWRLLKPQWPEIRYSSTKVNPVTGRPLKIVKYKPAHTMKKVPLRKMEQNFSDRFRFWFYDSLRTEATIVLGADNETWDAIRVYDPMWLRNLSEKDIEVLFKNPLTFAEDDREQAARFNNVISVLYQHKAHA